MRWRQSLAFVSDLARRSRTWIEGWLSRIGSSVGVTRRPYLEIDAARFLDSLSDAEAAPILQALDDIVDEPSYGHPRRYPRVTGPFAGEIVDLNAPGYRIVYRYSPISIRFRLIEPHPPNR